MRAGNYAVIYKTRLCEQKLFSMRTFSGKGGTVDISVIVPLYNEEESLSPLYEQVSDVMTQEKLTFEVLFVDDGSIDGSLAVLRSLAEKHDTVKVISFGRNYGKSAALAVGMEAAQGDVIITMDADLQDDPIAIPDMLKKLDEGFDLVSGWKQNRLDPVFTKNIPSKLFNGVTSRMAGVRLHDFNCGFKAYRSAAAKSLEIYGERHRFLPVLAHWNGFRVTEVPVPHRARQFGVSKFGIDRFFNGFFDLATLLFLRKYMRNPLHFFGLIGIALAMLGFSISVYFGVDWIVTRTIHVRPLMLLAVASMIMGIQFFSIGLVGEMISNVTAQKNYLEKCRVGFKGEQVEE